METTAVRFKYNNLQCCSTEILRQEMYLCRQRTVLSWLTLDFRDGLMNKVIIKVTFHLPLKDI